MFSEVSQVKGEGKEAGGEKQPVSSSFLFYHRTYLSPFVTSLYLTCSEFGPASAGPQATSSAYLLECHFLPETPAAGR